MSSKILSFNVIAMSSIVLSLIVTISAYSLLSWLNSDNTLQMHNAAATSTSANNTSTNASQVHSEADITPIAAVIMINTDSEGNTVFQPQQTTIKQGQEILIVNNSTVSHTVTNGMGPNDPMAGKRFNFEPIEAGSFAEFLVSYLEPSQYPFYSKTNPDMKGEIIVTPP
jgi:plastocyanin